MVHFEIRWIGFQLASLKDQRQQTVCHDETCEPQYFFFSRTSRVFLGFQVVGDSTAVKIA